MTRHRTMIACAAALALLMPWPASAQAGAPVDPSGVWLRDDGNARVRISACGDELCAVNIWIGDTSAGEEPGDILVMRLNPRSSSRLAGTAYDAKRDRTYSMSLTRDGDRLVTRGCVLGGLLCRSVGWTAAD